MLKQLTHTQVWVHDQDEALAFYTEKLGLELREDVTVPEMGNFRWLSVGVPGQPDVSITLMAVPGPPVFDEDTRAQIQALLAKGASGGLFFSTDDVRESCRTASTRGSATRRATTSAWPRRARARRATQAQPRRRPDRRRLGQALGQDVVPASAYRSEPGVVSFSPVSSSVFSPDRIIGQPP
jgi:catechol 2,3-dioxygenase-like lactoylglutathione lyase family enzyme